MHKEATGGMPCSLAEIAVEIGICISNTSQRTSIVFCETDSNFSEEWEEAERSSC